MFRAYIPSIFEELNFGTGPVNCNLLIFQVLKSLAAISFYVFRGIVVFLNFPSHYSFRRMDGRHLRDLNCRHVSS